MSLAVLQPAASGAAQLHYQDTIMRPVGFASHSSELGPELVTQLTELHPSGEAPMWGVTLGTNDSNRAKYEKMQPGDFVFFTGSGELFSGGTVTATFRNPVLARRLWGEDTRGQTWELMFTLDEVRDFNIPYEEFNHVVGYKPNFVPQGFNVLDAERSELIFDYLSLESERHPPVVTAEQLANALAGLNGETERSVMATQRLEQAFLRRALMPGPVAQCMLCRDVLPSEFLVAAHIKKRSECSNEERLDIPAVGMAACKFGCDALFESGYIGVDEFGAIAISRRAPSDENSVRHLSRFVGRNVGEEYEASARYFDWHFRHTFKN